MNAFPGPRGRPDLKNAPPKIRPDCLQVPRPKSPNYGCHDTRDPSGKASPVAECPPSGDGSATFDLITILQPAIVLHGGCVWGDLRENYKLDPSQICWSISALRGPRRAPEAPETDPARITVQVAQRVSPGDQQSLRPICGHLVILVDACRHIYKIKVPAL